MYQVIFQDEYNNLYLVGFYNKLEDSLEDVNDYLKDYDTKIDELIEYPSTFGYCFDKDIEVEEGMVMVRGFNLGKDFPKNWEVDYGKKKDDNNTSN